MNESVPSTHPVSQQDARAALGLVIVVQGELYAGQLDPHLLDRIRERVEDAGLVPAGSGPAELLLALDNLNHRLRWVIGEYPDPPPVSTSRVDHHFEFYSPKGAQGFAGEVAAVGEQVRGPAPTTDGRWLVTVTSAELMLSAGFTACADHLQATAARHGGRSGGYGGAAE